MAHHPHTEEEYYELKNGFSGLVVVDFSANWCGPCKAMEPVIQEFAEMYSNVCIIHVDVDELDMLEDVADVNRLPTFKFYRRGKFLEQFSGSNVELLEKNIKKLSTG